MQILSEKEPRILFHGEEIFADHEKNRRSGHLGHAMAQCADGSILAFYPNCSYNLPENYPGHSMHGWVLPLKRNSLPLGPIPSGRDIAFGRSCGNPNFI